MSARTKFGKLATDGNLLDAINALARRVAALETRDGHDASMDEADQILSLDPTGAIISMVNPSNGTPTYYTDPDTGALTCGGSVVTVDENGIGIAVTDNFYDKNSYKMTDGTAVVSYYSTYRDGGVPSYDTRFVGTSQSGYKTSVSFMANGAGTAFVQLAAIVGSNPAYIGITNVSGASAATITADTTTVSGALGIGGTPSGTYTLEVTGSILSGIVRSGVTGNLADDTVYAFAPGATTGAILIYGATNANEWGWIQYWAGASPVVNALSVGSAVVAGTAVLTDGTGNGTDAKLNVNASSGGTIYIKNRTGGTRNFRYLLI